MRREGLAAAGYAVLITVMVLEPIPSAGEAGVAGDAAAAVRAQGADPAGAGSPDPAPANP